MNSKPLVSVIIPTYNRASTIVRAIESVCHQTYSHIEILVIDDGSTDGTRGLIGKFASVRYFYQPNGGQASARNLGLQEARGEYIATLDSDDEWHPTFLEKCVQKLDSENFDFVFANWWQEIENDQFQDYLAHYPCLPESKSHSDESWVDLEYFELRQLFITGCPSPSSSLVLRRSRLKNGWCTDMTIGDDWCMILDIILHQKLRAAFTTEILWTKHVNGDNIVDGRDQLQVYRLLWVEDLGKIVNRYSALLTVSEKRILQSRYIKSMFINAILHLKKNHEYRQSLYFLKNAFWRWPLFTPFVFIRAVYSYISNGKDLSHARKKLGL